MYIILLFVINICIVSTCILNGNIEGKCIAKAYVNEDIEFCNKFVPDYICVPFHNVCYIINLFQPYWKEWTNKTTDSVVEKELFHALEKEFLHEINGASYMPLINSIGCFEAYIHYICKINFQACDPQLDQTITICRKVCEEFVSKCETHPKEICASLPVSNCKE